MLVTNEILSKIGKKIRERRNDLNKKLHEVAEEAQISKGLLSKIENGRSIPSLPVLITIIKTLKIDLSTFFVGVELKNSKNYIHKKKEEYTTFEKEEATGFLYHFVLNQSFSNNFIEVVLLDLEPHCKREKVVTDGFEYKYILKGQVEYHIGEEVVVLEQGDSLFFNGRIPHVPLNKTSDKASMLVIYFLSPSEG